MPYILYDTNCKFCTHFAHWSVKKQKNFSIISIRDNQSKILLRRFGIKFIDLQTIYFIEEQNVFVRSKAVFKILGFLNYPWKLIALFQYLPVKVTDFFYKLFAKYRYRIV